MKPIQESYIYT